ncbi:MAG: hypothetical protein WCO60_10985 [Verrucomicrobiota bacterium]
MAADPFLLGSARLGSARLGSARLGSGLMASRAAVVCLSLKAVAHLAAFR